MPGAVSAVFRGPSTSFPMPTGSVGAPSSAQPGTASAKLAGAVKRFGKDQADIYSAPFGLRNLKWETLVLAGTAGMIATDREGSPELPQAHPARRRHLYRDGTLCTRHPQ